MLDFEPKISFIVCVLDQHKFAEANIGSVYLFYLERFCFNYGDLVLFFGSVFRLLTFSAFTDINFNLSLWFRRVLQGLD
jgi:hypothetical protein